MEGLWANSLLRDVAANHVGSMGGCQNLKRDWATCFVKKCMGFSLRSLQKDLRASLAWDFGANGALWEKLSELLLVKFDDERFNVWSEKLEIGLCYDLLIGRENCPQWSRHLLFHRKNWMRVKIFIWSWRKLQQINNPITKEGRMVGFPFCLRLGS